MRTILRRNNRHQPCKSPSPDLAAKNIIKNTIIEVEDIRSKMKKAEQKQMKLDLQSSVSQVAPSESLSLESKYRQLYEECQRVRGENKRLGEQNRLLNQQNQRLSLQEERNRSLSQLNHLLLSRNENEVLRDKIVLLDEEKKRLERELATEREKGEQSLRNIERLRLEALVLRGERKEGLGLSEQESRLVVLSNNILSDREERLGQRLQELSLKISRIEMMQKIIKQQHSRIVAESSRVHKTPSSVKSSSCANNTTAKLDSGLKESPSTRERTGKEPLPLSTSPIEKHYRLEEGLVERLEQEITSLQEEVQARQSEIERMKIERERMGAVIHDLQVERKSLKVPTPKFRTPEDNIFKKFVTLEESINQNINHYEQECQHLQVENAQLRLQLASQQGRECEGCARREEEKGEFEARVRGVEGRLRGELEECRRRLEASEGSSARVLGLEEENERVRQLNRELVGELSNCRMMLEYIGAEVQAQQVEPLLKQNASIYCQLESTFVQEREEYDRCLSGYRLRLLEKEQEVMAMQSEVQVRQREAEVLRAEVEQLRRANLELQDHSLGVINSNLKFVGRERASKGKAFQANSEKVLELVRSGEDKLHILYQKINNSINLDIPHPLP